MNKGVAAAYNESNRKKRESLAMQQLDLSKGVPEAIE